MSKKTMITNLGGRVDVFVAAKYFQYSFFMITSIHFWLVLMALISPTVSASHDQSVQAATVLFNVSRAFLLHSNTSAFIFPLFSVAVSRAAFSYDDVALVTEVMVGSPPQKQRMVLDTGSELSWLSCNNAPPPPNFNPSISSSYNSIPCDSSVCKTQTKDFSIPTTCDGKRLCHFTYTYADGSDIEGNLARDRFSLPGLVIPGFVFGCSSSAPPPHTPGLMGLNRGALSLISQLNTKHKFSYCIADRVVSPQSAGVLLFGDSPFSKYLKYTPLLVISIPLPYLNRAAYTVVLEGIKVGDKMLPIPRSVFLPDHTGAGQTMIDSGTQFTLLLGKAYTVLKREFAQQNKGRMNPMNGKALFFGALDLCYDLPAATNQFPQVTPVTLLFKSTQLTLDSHQLLYRLPNGSATTSIDRAIYCFTFGNSDLVPVEANIIGNHHQQNLWIEYDLQNSRIGFARAACNNK